MTCARPTRLAAALSLLLGACNDGVSPHSPDPDDVAGIYLAQKDAGAASSFGTLTFTVVQNGISRDLLAEGSTIELSLHANGSTSGHLFVRDADQEGDLDADLTGSWLLDGDIVTLDHEADTFLRDMSLAVGDDRLEGEATFGGVVVRVVLRRQ